MTNKININYKCRHTFWCYVLYVASRLFPKYECPKWLKGKVTIYICEGDKVISKVQI